MNNKELQAARKLLMLDVTEAAEHIGHASPRAWQYWESGRNAVPDDVGEQVRMLLHMRRELIREIEQEAPAGSLTLRYFGSLGEFRAEHDDGTVLGWRLHQSAVAHFVGTGRAALGVGDGQAIIDAFQKLKLTEAEADAFIAATEEARRGAGK